MSIALDDALAIWIREVARDDRPPSAGLTSGDFVISGAPSECRSGLEELIHSDSRQLRGWTLVDRRRVGLLEIDGDFLGSLRSLKNEHFE